MVGTMVALPSPCRAPPPPSTLCSLPSIPVTLPESLSMVAPLAATAGPLDALAGPFVPGPVLGHDAFGPCVAQVDKQGPLEADSEMGTPLLVEGASGKVVVLAASGANDEDVDEEIVADTPLVHDSPRESRHSRASLTVQGCHDREQVRYTTLGVSPCTAGDPCETSGCPGEVMYPWGVPGSGEIALGRSDADSVVRRTAGAELPATA
jgi:hypothetical protein